MEQEGYFRNRDDLQLFYRRFDARETASIGDLPVLCLHGLTRNSRDFAALARHLAATHPVIVPDVRGRGFSDRDRDPTRYQPPVYADDMWQLLDHLGIVRCIIVGTSMGGIIAMIMAAQQRERVVGIVLNDVGPELDPVGLKRIADYTAVKTVVRNWDDAVRVSQRNAGAALPDLTPTQWLAYTRAAFREDARGIPQADYDHAIAAGFSSIDYAAAAVGAWALFDQLTQPILVLRGALSDLLSADVVGKMQQHHADLAAVEIPRRGHAPLLDEPESVAAIDTFLARLAHAGTTAN